MLEMYVKYGFFLGYIFDLDTMRQGHNDPVEVNHYLTSFGKVDVINLDELYSVTTTRINCKMTIKKDKSRMLTFSNYFKTYVPLDRNLCLVS